MTLLVLQKGLSLEDAISAPTVRQTITKMGEPTVVKLVCAVIRLFNDSLNTSLQMTPMQLFEAAHLWCEEYPHETLKDLILCLKRAKSGRYGPIFNRVDVAVIGEFFIKYLDEKALFRESQHYQQKGNRYGEKATVIDSLPDEQRHQLTHMLKRPDVRSTDVNAPILNHREYIDWLRANITTLKEDLLIDLEKRSSAQGIDEVLAIVQTEKQRRIDERNQLLDEYENDPDSARSND